MAWVIASAPVQAVRCGGSPTVSSGSRSASDGFSPGWQIQNFMPLPVWVIIAVLSVSAPVPAVVGMVTRCGNGWSGPISAGGASHSKSHRSISLRAVRQIALPPSMALPPPMAMTASWPPDRNAALPAAISVSLGFGEISENRPAFMPAAARIDIRPETNGSPALPLSVTTSGARMPSPAHCTPISASRPGP